jgi:general secretion pathway protein B
MSYILDALKKSEQQRQRGAAPITLATPTATLTPRSPAGYRTGLLALALIAAGIAIGWLRPWQSSTSIPTPTPTIVVKPHISVPPPAPHPVVAATPVAAAQPVQAPPARVAERESSPPAEAVAAPSVKPAQPVEAITAKPVAAEAGEPLAKTMALGELPQAVRQTLPAIAIALHAYARDPKDRVVMINNQMLRQGDLVAPGLRLEQITQEGVVLGYQGYRIQRGVR